MRIQQFQKTNNGINDAIESSKTQFGEDTTFTHMLREYKKTIRGSEDDLVAAAEAKGKIGTKEQHIHGTPQNSGREASKLCGQPSACISDGGPPSWT